MRLARVKEMTTSGPVEANRANLLGVLLGTDGINNVRFSCHNGTSSSDQKVVPSATYDAAALGLNGVMFTFLVHCPNGIYFNEESGTNYECIVYYETY
jgi:hypothetical protein